MKKLLIISLTIAGLILNFTTYAAMANVLSNDPVEQKQYDAEDKQREIDQKHEDIKREQERLDRDMKELQEQLERQIRDLED